MIDFHRTILPWLMVALCAGIAIAADRAATVHRRSSDRDRGNYWSTVVLWTALLLGLPLLASTWIETISASTWQAGWHLHFDRTGGWGLAGTGAYLAALGLPIAVWSGVLGLGLLRRPRGGEDRSVLAGSLSESGSRWWVLGLALPLAIVLFAAYPRLGGGPHAYPAATWSLNGVLLVSLCAIASSRRRRDGSACASSGSELESGRRQTLPPWPETLSAGGIDLRPIASWPGAPPSTPPARERRRGILQLGPRLEQLGATGIEPPLVEAVEALLDPLAPTERERLIYAPDHAGQTEVVAGAAAILAERFHERTLIITPRDAAGRAATLRRWLEGRGEEMVQCVEPGTELQSDALVWVVDAETLSNWFLPERLSSRGRHSEKAERLQSLGLVVWWDLHEYSGVLGANLWAVSRRLDRLLRRWGHPDIRTLALMRRVAHGRAEPERFVQSLLPHAFRGGVVHVGRRFARDTKLHVVESADPDAPGFQGRFPPSALHPLTLATRVSVDGGWATHLVPPPEVSDDALVAVLAGEGDGQILDANLRIDPAEAAASLLEIGPEDVLALPDLLARRGRSSPPSLPHHVGITPPDNPYVANLLRQLEGHSTHGAGGDFSSSRRLVCAEGTPAILRRHVLLALEELPDTREGLSRDFKREDELIRETLDHLAEEGQLQRRPVRSLDERESIRLDHLYTSTKAGTETRSPLTTVGGGLVEVIDTDAGHDRGGVQMRVDPERLAIEAYPGRLFSAGGRRYRIDDWSSREEAIRRGRVTCQQESVAGKTWRLRRCVVYDLDPGDEHFVTLAGTTPLSRLVVNARYEEKLRGLVRLELDPSRGAPHPPQVLDRHQITTVFSTRALVLRMEDLRDSAGLVSLAQALRHVLPVHVGVSENALEVVPLLDEPLRGQHIWGLAVVDLFPGGVGLVDALRHDDSLLRHLLQQALDWLTRCPCQNDTGCPRCLDTPAALAVDDDLPPGRGAAVDLLTEVLDRAPDDHPRFLP